ncbi:hypothetical protein [Streptomyces chumphonensis]|uniref:DUF7848 domain-containing protein n=1 Tax=Streptomyces chumphonensis TaxID=1214925 RepID=UPI003D742355
MTARLFRHQLWTVGADTLPDAEPVGYAAECSVCRARSGECSTPEHADAWILAHVGGHPDHLTYRALTAQPRRTWRRSTG